MAWNVISSPEFAIESRALPREVQRALAARLTRLAKHGPALDRPHVDTLSGSRHRNMKELRFNAGNGVWRVAFAFDPERQAIVLVAGDKRGVNTRQFYRRLIRVADSRLDAHLARSASEGRR